MPDGAYFPRQRAPVLARKSDGLSEDLDGNLAQGEKKASFLWVAYPIMGGGKEIRPITLLRWDVRASSACNMCPDLQSSSDSGRAFDDA